MKPIYHTCVAIAFLRASAEDPNLDPEAQRTSGASRSPCARWDAWPRKSPNHAQSPRTG